MDLKITKKEDYIKIDSDSYILLKDSEKLYETIRDAYEKSNFETKKWIIHEQVLDVLIYEVNKMVSFEIDINSQIRFFGLPVEILKRESCNSGH